MDGTETVLFYRFECIRFYDAETVEVTPLRRTLSSSS